MSVERIQVPDLGDSDEVEVIEILVSVGEEISENDSILVLESDKAAMEIPSPMSGKVTEILAKVGDQVSQGVEIVVLEVAGSGSGAKEASAASIPASAPEPEVVADAAPVDTSASSTSTQLSIQEIKVPDLGEDSDVEVIEILVAEGDEVQLEDGLITLETDKAAMDVPSSAAGKVISIKLKVGDKVSEGSVILEMETAQEANAEASAAAPDATATSSAPSVAPASVASPAPSEPASQVPVVQSGGAVYAGPAVRKLARKLGVDLTRVAGSGIKARIVKEDVHAFVKAALSQNSAPASAGTGLPVMVDIDYTKFGEVEEVEMTKLHRLTAQNMSRNWLTVPHVTQFEEADITDLENFRKAQKKLAETKGIKLSPLPFIIKACAQALVEFPQFNVSMHSSGAKLIQKKYIHIGVAVATPAGLMVPVIKNADQKSIWQLAAELAELGAKAKSRKLTKDDMEGGCFTISSLGGLGGTGFTPIVNSPEVAIMGVSKASIKPIYIDGEFVPRNMLPYSLSYDHRAVNGIDGGMFCNYITGLLSDIRLMVL